MDLIIKHINKIEGLKGQERVDALLELPRITGEVVNYELQKAMDDIKPPVEYANKEELVAERKLEYKELMRRSMEENKKEAQSLGIDIKGKNESGIVDSLMSYFNINKK